MTILKEQIAQRTKGQLGEKEDWWYLCYDADADIYYIEHKWHYVDAYKVSRGSDSGTERHAIEGWSGQGSDEIDAARIKLAKRAGKDQV